MVTGLGLFTNFSDTNGSILRKRLVSRQSQALQRAGALYRTMRFAGQISRFLSWLFHQSEHLMDASQILSDEILAYRFSGLKFVSINRILASETCTHDFDLAFNPLNDRNRTRWINIAAITLLGARLPPVDLIHVQDTYIVRDGHLRISVAGALGQENIAAYVIHVPNSAKDLLLDRNMVLDYHVRNVK